MNTRITLSALGAAMLSLSAVASDPTPLHSVESYCATYEMTGLNKGQMTTCQRAYGHERYEKWDTKIGIGPFSKRDQRHIIYSGETIYTYDGKKGTRATNPIYTQLSERMKTLSPDELQEGFMEAMQYNPTGETKDVNGTPCAVNTSTIAGTVCITEDGILAEQRVMGQTQRLVSLDVGDPGADEMYDPNAWAAPIEDAPDVGKIVEQISDAVAK